MRPPLLSPLRTNPTARHRVVRGRPRLRGQGMIEFALIAPMLFALLIGIINGGAFMYVKAGISRAANVAMIDLAAYSNAIGADVTAISDMRATGVGNQALTQVTDVRIEQVSYNSGTNTYSAVSTCGSGGNSACVNDFNIDGTPQWSIPVGCSDATYHCPPWPPTSRSIHASSASIIKMTIFYTYQFIGANVKFSLTEVKIFRVEPKDL